MYLLADIPIIIADILIILADILIILADILLAFSGPNLLLNLYHPVQTGYQKPLDLGLNMQHSYETLHSHKFPNSTLSQPICGFGYC